MIWHIIIWLFIIGLVITLASWVFMLGIGIVGAVIAGVVAIPVWIGKTIKKYFKEN